MATPPATTDTKRRSFSMSIDIDATPEVVWRALTDAGELMRWFPLQARVTPGKGGTVFWGWDEHWAWESQIDAWEPEHCLRLVENRPAFDVNGEPLRVRRSSWQWNSRSKLTPGKRPSASSTLGSATGAAGTTSPNR